MIQHLLVLSLDGHLVLHRNYHGEELIGSLFSAFMSAINTFAKQTMGYEINQIQVENRYITVKRGKEIIVVLISSHCQSFEDQSSCICIPTTLDHIIQEYEKRYDSFPEEGTRASFWNPFAIAVDEIVGKHFNTHFYLENFIETLNKGIVSDGLLGVVVFKNSILFHYQLSSLKTMENIRYQILINITNIWRSAMGTLPSYQIVRFDNFTVVSSYHEPWTLFTIWDSKTPDAALPHLQKAAFKSYLEFLGNKIE
ncbi:MAG: hypothetical protein ACFFC7_25480 [Candidatus Hermodarchaeota archaeon]